MLLGTDKLTILRGSKYYGTWQWINSVTGNAEDFAGLTGTVKIKNIHEDFEDVKNTYEVGTVVIEPNDIDGNPIKGRVDIDLSKTDTLHFQIPKSEDDRYGESDFYSVLSITLSTGEVILQAQVRVVESLESETLNFLIEERDEAIIINGKLDNILARNNEFISTRDNLIDVVIPTAISTYNTNHNEKLGIYNANHNDKLSTYNTNDTSKTNTYNLNHAEKLQEVNTLALTVQSDKEIVELAKANVLAMKDNVQGNKESVEAMKLAVESMLDSFDDRFLGLFDENPLVDNDGNVLKVGTIYYNNIVKELKFYNGVSWDSPVAAAQTYALQASQSASDALASKNAAKISEDNAKASEQNTQTIAGQVANNYEPKNANIQSHISNSTNPHGTTAAQVGAYSTSETDTKLNLKIDIANIIDDLNSTLANKPLSANQGKILKGYIDSINTLLTSNDTSLDTLQEIVAYIKANKNNLDALADIHSKTAKTTLADADEFMTADSTSSFSLKKITWSSIKTLLMSLFNVDANGNMGTGTQSFNGFGGSGLKNVIINGGFDIWQRGTSIDSGFAYRADRWFGYRGGAFPGLTVSKQLGILANTNSARVQRNSGNNNTQVNIFKQPLETIESMRMVGKEVTLSFYARKGIDYSSNGNLLYSAIQEHTSIDGPMIDVGTSNNQANILTTNWQKFTHTYTIQATTTQIAIIFFNNPTGTAGANDYYEVTNVQLEIGSIATPFEQRPYGLELSLCQRYFEKSYADNVAIGTLTNENAYCTSNLSPYLFHAPIVNFKVQKRTQPTIVFYNPYASNTGNAIEYNTGSVAVSDRPIYALNVGKNSMKIQSTNGSLVTGNFVLFHYTASAEL